MQLTSIISRIERLARCATKPHMDHYRIIETNRIPGGSTWIVARQESDIATNFFVISTHESLLGAMAAKAGCEKRDADFVATLLRQREAADRKLCRLWDARIMDSSFAVMPPEPPKDEDAIAQVEAEIARINTEISKYI